MPSGSSHKKSPEPFIGGEPKGWKKLWRKAQAERDPKKLIKLLEQLNALLTEQEKRQEEEHTTPPRIQSRARTRS